jgi:hypothetical protein
VGARAATLAETDRAEREIDLVEDDQQTSSKTTSSELVGIL